VLLTGKTRGRLGSEIVKILRARLQTAAASADALTHFYGGLEFGVGSTVMAFDPVPEGRPFYHFALRVPRNRFARAREWLASRAELLAGRDGETTFEFEFWNAQACYALDPGDNILELIAHRELPDESPLGGPFGADELLGICELGLVGPDTRAIGAALEALGIDLWSGTLDEPGKLAFMGGRDGVLILSQPGRGWRPTGRPAEIHPVDVTVAGPRTGVAHPPGTPHRVRTVAG
jgi:hypothetical protein